MFWNKKKKNIITTKITKSSSQVQYEQGIDSLAFKKSNTCPECGHINDDWGIPIGAIDSNGNSIYYGKCEKCGAKWEVKYKL